MFADLSSQIVSGWTIVIFIKKCRPVTAGAAV